MTCLGDPCKRVRIILSGGVRGETQQSLSFARYRGAMRRLAFAAQVCASIRSARRHWIMAPRLTPFEVGQIFALCREGFSHRDIAARVTRGRGPDTVSFGSVGEAVRRLADAARQSRLANRPELARSLKENGRATHAARTKLF